MAEAAGDEAKDPFDAQASGREPFPPFEAALAADAADTDAESALNWSIDTLAELKPVPFSPLAEQKQASGLDASHGASGFFEDEKQYEVLRTPLNARAPIAANRSQLTPSPSPSHPLELHRRCRETIARCEARVRERQRKMDSLQAVLPPRTPKRASSDRQSQRSSSPLRSTPRPAKRNKPSVFTPINDCQSPKPPMWSASPIAMVETKKTRATPRSYVMTPSPLSSTPINITRQSLHSKQRLSFGLSPIMFSSPDQQVKSDLFSESEEEKDEGKIQEPQLSKGDTLPSSFAATPLVKSGKENDEQQGDQLQDASPSSNTASSSPLNLTPSTSPPKESSAPTRSSIPRRQQAFMAAMEAEASKNRSRDSSDNSNDKRSAASSPSPILSLYQEAKQLGMSDPMSQWEYVQLLRQSDNKQKQK